MDSNSTTRSASVPLDPGDDAFENPEESSHNSNLLCLPMPPDHEYEIPMFSRDALRNNIQRTGLVMMESVNEAPSVSDPFHGLSSEEEETIMNDLFPPSLQQLLESAYSSMYEEALLLEEQEVPYDQHILNILDSNDGDPQEQVESLDVLGEVEMKSSPAPASPTHCASLNHKRSSIVKARDHIQMSSASLSSADGTECDEGHSASADEGSKGPNIKRRRLVRCATERKLKESSLPSGPGRDGYIENKCLRKRRFIDGLQTLITKIRQIRSRTGANGEFVATFEGQEYSIENVKYESSLRARNGKRKAVKLKQQIPEAKSSDELEDDHRYAATLLTQKLSSPTVRDHQYNEASCTGNQAKDGSKGHVYVRLQYQRDRTFEQFLRSTFSRVRVLEIRTAAMVNISFDYEGCKFTNQNFNDVNIILQSKRNRRNVVSRVDVEHVQRPDGTKVCRLYHRPSCTPADAEDDQKNESRISVEPLESGRYINASEVVLDGIQPPVKLIVTGVHSSLAEPRTMVNNMQDNWNCTTKLLIESVQNKRGISESSISSETASDVRTDEHRSPSPILAKDSTDTETDEQSNQGLKKASHSSSSLPPCPGNTGTAATAGSTANPICTKCQGYLPRNTAMREDGFVPWIRCFDPFCQYLVHAPCIGFYVTCRRDLKRLPPYYCEAHRDDM